MVNQAKEKKTVIDGPSFRGGLAVGSLVTAFIAAIIGMKGCSNDLARGAFEFDPAVGAKTDQLATEIAKNPALQKHWKTMRAVVDDVSRRIDEIREKAATDSEKSTQHWRDRAAQIEPSSGRNNAP